MPKPIQWVTTAATTRAGEPRGWKLHAVEASDSEKFSEIDGRKAKCGLKTPWGLDLFVEEKCSRCLRALGLACPACNGRRSTGSTRDGTWQFCGPCGGSGEKRS